MKITFEGQEVELTSINVKDVSEDDVLVVKATLPVSRLEELQQFLEQQFDCKVISIPKDIDIEVIKRYK